MENLKFEQALTNAQARLHAPKGEKNAFSGWNYRNAEGIYLAVKPLLVEFGLLMSISDDVILVGDRFYICSTVRITGHGGEAISKGWAREEFAIKGNNAGQISGLTASYARKYAMCAAFLIDGSDQDLDTLPPPVTLQDMIQAGDSDGSVSFYRGLPNKGAQGNEWRALDDAGRSRLGGWLAVSQTNISPELTQE